MAQVSTNIERDAAIREQQERTPDIRLPRPAQAVAQQLPESETPCFAIHQLALKGDEATHFNWLLDALSGPNGHDAPLHKCLGAQGVNLVLQRAQDDLVARG